MEKEIYSIQHMASKCHYDTWEECFFPENWKKSNDTKEYLENLIRNNPDKLGGCVIVKNI